MSQHSGPASQSPDQRWASLRLIALTMTAAPIMLGVVMLMVFAPEDRFAAPATWLVVAQVVAAVVIFVLCESLLYRTPAIRPGTDPTEASSQALRGYQAAFFQRVAVCEGLAIVSIAAAFIVQPLSWLSVAVGVVLSFLLMLIHVLPHERNITKTLESLQRDGARVTLR